MPVSVTIRRMRAETSCRRCLSAPSGGQLRIFDPGGPDPDAPPYDDGAVLAPGATGWPEVGTGPTGRSGFWRERTPTVFGNRVGVGPLIAMPDTNILIEIRDQLAEVEGAMIIYPEWDAHDDRIGALRELVQLWWFRDLRFAVGPEHLADSKRRPLVGERKRAREEAVEELEVDFFERGGIATSISEGDGVSLEDQPCILHAVSALPPQGDAARGRDRWRWPNDALDRDLVEAAYDGGCHVFITEDKKVLRCHRSLYSRGLAVLTPGELLQALENSGELEGTRGGGFLLPDISTLARLYGGFSD